MIRHFVLEIIKYYLLLTLVFTVVSIIRMYVVETFACNKKKGIKRIEELMSQGRFRQYPIYDFDEVRIRRKRGVALRFHLRLTSHLALHSTSSGK